MIFILLIIMIITNPSVLNVTGNPPKPGQNEVYSNFSIFPFYQPLCISICSLSGDWLLQTCCLLRNSQSSIHEECYGTFQPSRVHQILEKRSVERMLIRRLCNFPCSKLPSNSDASTTSSCDSLESIIYEKLNLCVQSGEKRASFRLFDLI